MDSYHRSRIDVVAHRGASGYAPENTLQAFLMALAMNAQHIELDVHMSRDGEIVVIHDPQVDRTSNGKGAVASLSLTQLKNLDAGSWFNRSHPRKARAEFTGSRIPTLQGVIDLVRATATGLYIEIKDPELYPDTFESKIVSLLKRNKLERKAVLISFNAGSVVKVKELDPTIQTGLLVSSSKMDPVSAASSIGANELAIRHTLLTPGIVRKARSKGLRLSVWTVNTEMAIQRMIALGVDRIMSNYPDRAMRLLREPIDSGD